MTLRRMRRCMVVVGGQYGSEGKGNVISAIANDWDVHVRTGGPNAGHSHQFAGRVFKQQVLPVGWINPDASIVIGRGSLVPVDEMMQELADAFAVDNTVVDRLFLDEYAGVLDRTHYDEEGGVGGEIHKRLGSTGKGVGAARMARMSRDESRFYHMGSILQQIQRKSMDYGIPDVSARITDTVGFLYGCQQNMDILIEGTQGSGLSLIHGPWPFVTSADVNAAAFMSEAGISPRRVSDVMVVIRTMPIRVAGNSGPLSNEVSWAEVSNRVGRAVTEQTTVTKLTRRVGEWDEHLVRRAIVLNDPTTLAINFIDYLTPEDEGKTEFDDLSPRSKMFVEYLETTFGVHVGIIGTGGPTWNVIKR